MKLLDETPVTPPIDDPEANMDADRRAALAKLGKVAAWTPPVMLTLMLSKRASALS